MNKFYDSRMDIGRDDFKTDLTVAFQEEKSAPYLNRTFELHLLQEGKDDCNDSLRLIYLKYDCDGDAFDSRIKSQLSNLHSSIQNLTLLYWRSYGPNDSVAEYIDTLMKTPHDHLENLCIQGGNFMEYVETKDFIPTPRAPHIKQLVFKG